MKRTCINSPVFTRIYDQLIAEHKLSEQDFEAFEQELLKDPKKGKVIPRLEGLRKYVSSQQRKANEEDLE